MPSFLSALDSVCDADKLFEFLFDFYDNRLKPGILSYIRPYFLSIAFGQGVFYRSSRDVWRRTWKGLSHSQSCDSIHLLTLRIRKSKKWSLNNSVKLNHWVPLPQWQMPPSHVTALQRCADCVGHHVHLVLTPQLLCEVIQLCFSQEPPSTELYPNAFMFCLEIQLTKMRYNTEIHAMEVMTDKWAHPWCLDLYHMPCNMGIRTCFLFCVLANVPLYFS